MNPEPFFAYARERYRIFLKKEDGEPAPWTDDPILREFRFCNVFREDDRNTRWIRKYITHAGFGNRLLGAFVIARWFNRIETLERLFPPKGCELPYFQHNLFYIWADYLDADGHLERWKQLMRERLEGVSPMVTAAYMVKTPAKMSKLEGLLWCFDQILPHCREMQFHIEPGETSLEAVTGVLAEFPYLGPFMAYEIACDLQHTELLREAPDTHSWANPGPGAARGLCRVLGEPLDHFNRHKRADVDKMIGLMRWLLRLSGPEEGLWPKAWPAWDMRTVEHTLCEFDKYERARLGEGKPKQRYQPRKGDA